MGGGEYAFYIWSAYGVTGLTVAALLVWAVVDHRAQTRALARLEAVADASGPSKGAERARVAGALGAATRG